ncbi:MAG: hypothetical protein HYY16_07890 [Planctomycetes bacterium]|nr:hypothetical protein [Planctomycetota bacterium]
MLEKIKKLLGVKDLPEEVSPLYRGARNEREALILLKEARRRDESRRKRSMQDLEILDKMEEELLEEGKGETGESRKLMIARRIKEIRWKIQELNNRIENIYNKRIKVFNEHVASLETVLELTSEELPDKKNMEEMAIKAKNLLEDLEKSKELAEGITQSEEPPQPDEEEREILQEMERRADLELEKAKPEEKEAEKPEAPVRERPQAEKEKPKHEKKREEKKPEEPPEILYEE